MAVSVGKNAAPMAGLKADPSGNKNPNADAALAAKETAAQNKGKIAVVVDKEHAIPAPVVKAVTNLRVELVGHARLHYNGTLYEAGVVYEHTREYAEHLLSLIGIKQLPIFKLHAVAKPKPVVQTATGGKPLVNLAAVKTATSTTVPEPAVPGAEAAQAAGAQPTVANLEDGDEADPELAAHLAAAAALEQNGEEPPEAHATV
jgi:hypothetical protein